MSERQAMKRKGRRELLAAAAGVLAGAVVAPRVARSAGLPAGWIRRQSLGRVSGEPAVEPVGARILAEGGNAFDAVVAAALAGAVRQPQQCGIGGYCVHGVFATLGGKRIVTLDANSAAPAGTKKDLFKPDATGNVPDKINEFGWLASSVPPVLAGLDLVRRELGTRPLSELLQPAIAIARDGFNLSSTVQQTIKNSATIRKDPGSRRLFLPGGQPPPAGWLFRNPDLAELLQTLARDESVDRFYHGDVAGIIADAFAANGGLLTREDLARYEPHLREPLTLSVGERTVHAGPLTAGSFSTLQMLNALRALDWASLSPGPDRAHARIETMRIGWRDRLVFLADPAFADVPQQRLLSDDYAADTADRVRFAVRAGNKLSVPMEARPQGGTLNFSVVDRDGNLAALTITHGNSFGSQVTVDGLGLTLGHAMSRFDPHPDHPNAPAPFKRPLHNMTPLIITRAGRPVVAVGGRGGRKIPSSMLEFLIQFMLLERPLQASIDAPRFHVEGEDGVEYENDCPADDRRHLERLGFKMRSATPATLSAVSCDESGSGEAMR